MLLAACRLLVGGAGMFWFLRRIGLSGWASGVGGIAYLLSPVTIVWLEHPLADVSPWLPWMLLAADRAADGGPARLGGLAFADRPDLRRRPSASRAVRDGPWAPPTPSPPRWRGRGRCLASPACCARSAWVPASPPCRFCRSSSTRPRAAAIEMRTAYALNPFVAPFRVLMTALVPDAFGHPGYANYAGPLNYLEQTEPRRA